MNNYNLLIITVLYCFCFYYFIKYYNKNFKIQHTSNYKSRLKYYSCSYIKLNKVIKSVLKNKNIIRTEKNKEWNIYIPCGYTYVEKELNTIKITKPNQFIFAIRGSDKIASKNNLWKIVSDYYGKYEASQLLPKSYIINNNKDIKAFKNDYDTNNIYLLKKNIQRKEGILITNNFKQIMKIVERTNNKMRDLIIHSRNNVIDEEKFNKNIKLNTLVNSYKIIQLYIQNVFLINKRKCNLRLYLLISSKHNKKEIFLYKYGKCIYTNKDYKDTTTTVSFNKEEHLTSYNLDTNIYNVNPQSLEELKEFLGLKNYYYLWNNIVFLFKKISNAIKPEVCNSLILENATTFQVLGADIIFTDKFKPYLLELNKGPSMKPSNSQDYEMKIKMHEDVFKKVGFIKSNSVDHEFIRL